MSVENRIKLIKTTMIVNWIIVVHNQVFNISYHFSTYDAPLFRYNALSTILANIFWTIKRKSKLPNRNIQWIIWIRNMKHVAIMRKNGVICCQNRHKLSPPGDVGPARRYWQGAVVQDHARNDRSRWRVGLRLYQVN